MAAMIYAGQGPVYLGDFDLATKSLANMVAVGCVTSSLKLSPEHEVAEIKETCSGARGVKARYEKSKTINVELALTEFDALALAEGLYGQHSMVAASTVTDETMPTMVAGGFYSTRHPKISTVVVKDSAGTPATLVADTDYSVDSADYGRIKILNIGTFVQPFTVDYAYAGRDNIKPFLETSVVRGLIFNGISTVDSSKVRVFLPRIAFDMTKEFDFISEDVVSLTRSGTLLVTDLGATDPILGGYGSIDLL